MWTADWLWLGSANRWLAMVGSCWMLTGLQTSWHALPCPPAVPPGNYAEFVALTGGLRNEQAALDGQAASDEHVTRKTTNACAPRTLRQQQSRAPLAEAAEVLFDHGRTELYTATREQLEQRQVEERAPPAAAPSPAAAAEVAREFGSGWAVLAAAPSDSASGRRHHRKPPPAAPAAAAEPNVDPDMAGAALFAAELQTDVLQEAPAGDLPPQASRGLLCCGSASPGKRSELLA